MQKLAPSKGDLLNVAGVGLCSVLCTSPLLRAGFCILSISLGCFRNFMIRRSVFLLVLAIAGAIVVDGQSPHTPEKGSPERKAILDALRVPIERDLKQKIVFVADNFNVHGNWAFVGGTPQAVSGGSPDYGRTQYADAKESGAFDNNFFALLKKTSGKWKVVTYAIGCTDVCYADWWKRFKAPKAVFPYTE